MKKTNIIRAWKNGTAQSKGLTANPAGVAELEASLLEEVVGGSSLSNCPLTLNVATTYQVGSCCGGGGPA